MQPGLQAGRLTPLAHNPALHSALYCLHPGRQSRIASPLRRSSTSRLLVNACPRRLRCSCSLRLPPSRALDFRHTAKPTIHLPLSISRLASDPIIIRGLWFCSSLHHLPLVVGPHPRLARSSPPLSRNKLPNYSRLLTKPRELLATTSLSSRQSVGRSVPLWTQG